MQTFNYLKENIQRFLSVIPIPNRVQRQVRKSKKISYTGTLITSQIQITDLAYTSFLALYSVDVSPDPMYSSLPILKDFQIPAVLADPINYTIPASTDTPYDDTKNHTELYLGKYVPKKYSTALKHPGFAIAI